MYKGMQLISLQLIGFNMISLVIPECGRLPKSLQVIMCEATGTWRQDSVASANLTHWILYRPAHARVGHGGWLNEPRRALGLVEDHHGQRPPPQIRCYGHRGVRRFGDQQVSHAESGGENQQHTRGARGAAFFQSLQLTAAQVVGFITVSNIVR